MTIGECIDKIEYLESLAANVEDNGFEQIKGDVANTLREYADFIRSITVNILDLAPRK